jgi:hypothetical protein
MHLVTPPRDWLAFEREDLRTFMPARLSIDERLRRTQQLRHEQDPVRLRLAISKALQDSANLVVAEAAKLIRENELPGFEPDLLNAWQRMLVDPLKSDKGCTAKTAIIEALDKLDYDEPDFYQTGIAYRQLEPVWGGTADTAENVRGACALAIARSRRMGIVEKMNVLVDLIVDRGSRMSRVYGIQALANTGSEHVVPLLRFILLSGDSEFQVLGACMVGLLRLAPQAAVVLVSKFLQSTDEDVVLEAAAALGECGRADAVEILIAVWRRSRDAEIRKSLLVSIGLSRDSSALSFLISRVEENSSDSATALRALAPSCVYSDVRQRVHNAVIGTKNPSLQVDFDNRYPS